jgi:hypothetical protein
MKPTHHKHLKLSSNLPTRIPNDQPIRSGVPHIGPFRIRADSASTAICGHADGPSHARKGGRAQPMLASNI